jgi:hypothetical protein
VVFAADIGDSFQRTLDEFFEWLPKLIGALIILVIGYIIARVVAKVVRKAISAAGGDKAVASGKAAVYKQQFAPTLQPSDVISKIAFWFVFGSAILLAVSALGIEALENAVAGVVAYLPNVIAAILILLVAVAIAGAVGGLASRLAGGTMLGKLVQTIVPTLVIVIALFMALVQLKIATQIVIATYVLVLGAIALGFALAFGLGGRQVAARMLESAYASGQQALPQIKAEAQLAKDQAALEAERLKHEAEQRTNDPPAGGAHTRPA